LDGGERLRELAELWRGSFTASLLAFSSDFFGERVRLRGLRADLFGGCFYIDPPPASRRTLAATKSPLFRREYIDQSAMAIFFPVSRGGVGHQPPTRLRSSAGVVLACMLVHRARRKRKRKGPRRRAARRARARSEPSCG
jgi:hypothetical protein